VLTIAQIETRAGVENVRSIAAVEGLDVLLVGPNDLAVSLGCPGQLRAPVVSAAIERIAQAAAEHGKVFGIHAPTEFLAGWRSHGMRFFLNEIDVNLL